MANVKSNNIEILIKGVILGQGRGAYSLKDASLMHQVIKCVLDEKNTSHTDAECINALIQGASIAQKAGAFTLDDAALVFEAIKWFESESKPKKLETIQEE